MPTSRIHAAAQQGLTLPASGQLVVFNAQAGADYAALGADPAECLQNDFVVCASLGAEGRVVDAEPGTAANVALVETPRSRAQALGMIGRATQSCAPGGIVAVNGDKAFGIEGLLKQVSAVADVATRVSKAHGKVFWFRADSLPADVATDWTDRAGPAKNRDGWITAPGMFSADGIDPASALLADNLPSTDLGQVADLGAGWGYLAGAALDRGAASVALFDSDRDALQAAQANLADRPARYEWCDVRALPHAGVFDTIVMNPPFHDSGKAAPVLGMAFIETARRMLHRGGRLFMVANRHLPYEASLEDGFARVTPVAQTGHFKVIRAEGPRARRDRPAR